MGSILSLPTSVLLELGVLTFLFCCYVVFMVVRFPDGGARLSAFIERLLSLREKANEKRNRRSLRPHVKPQKKEYKSEGDIQ